MADSELVSAFAAYNPNGKKAAPAAKKNNARKNATKKKQTGKSGGAKAKAVNVNAASAKPKAGGGAQKIVGAGGAKSKAAGGAKPMNAAGAAKPKAATAAGAKPMNGAGGAKPKAVPAGGAKAMNGAGGAKPKAAAAGGAKPMNMNGAGGAKPKAATGGGAKSMNRPSSAKPKTAAGERGAKPKAIEGAKQMNGPGGIAKKKEAAKKANNRQKKADTSSDFGIKSDEVDELVDKLLNDSGRKLSAEEQKKKKQLEAYLVHNLAKDIKRGGVNSSGANGDKDDAVKPYTLYSSGSSSFTEEYSLTGSSFSYLSDEEEGEEEESWTDATDESENENENVTFSLEALQTQNAPTTKRKSTNNNNNGNMATKSSEQEAIAAKKAKKTDAAPAMSASTRKSLPNATSTVQQPTTSSATAAAARRSEQLLRSSSLVKLEPMSPLHANVVKMNSITEGEKIFRWLLSPITVDNFYQQYWEKGVCLVKRKQSDYFAHLISFQAIDQMLLQNHVEFTKNIDVTLYEHGKRQTLNPEGRAMPGTVWEHYAQGCSIRLLNPATFLPSMFTMNTTLQEYFHCLVGANVYLTPPHSQGFAPHYDDIEAFVLQVEGRKRWRLYAPQSQREMLPRVSSENFKQHEIGTPILDEVLNPGDMLYFPRGTIHQACTEPGHHSLHITLSVYQKQSFADLFEQLTPLMLQRAIAHDVDMRRGLPLSTWQHAGLVHGEADTRERAELLQRVHQLLMKSVQSMPLEEIMDAAVDQLAKRFQREALPPELLPSERARTVFGLPCQTNEQGECVRDCRIDAKTNVRLLRANVLRLVDEDGKKRIYYYVDNSREYGEYEANFLEIGNPEAACVAVLIRSYPAYVGVSELPLAKTSAKIEVIKALWERGLLMTEKPLK